jgi:predicted RNA-binding protein Jag
MNSLGLILKQKVQNKLGIRINIILDVEEYKEKQQKNIERLAIKLAREVVKTGDDVKAFQYKELGKRYLQ